MVSRLSESDIPSKTKAEAESARVALSEQTLPPQAAPSELEGVLLSAQLGIPAMDLRKLAIPPAVLALIPGSLAWNQKVLPVALKDDALWVATETPTDHTLLQTLRLATGRRIQPVLPLRGGLREALEANYSVGPKQLAEDLPATIVRTMATPIPNAGAAGEVYQTSTKARGASTAEQPPSGVGAPWNKSRQLWLWGTGILFFGFGDTLTSLLVFGSGGREANVLLALVLTVLGRSLWAFLALKLVAMLTLMLLSRRQPRVELVTAWAMLGAGLFLVGQNSTILLLGR